MTSRENLSVVFEIPSSKKYLPLGAEMVMYPVETVEPHL